MKNLIYILLAVFTISCSSTKSIQFSQKENDIFTNQNLKDFLATHKSPKVVLRVPLSSGNVTEKDENSYLYNAIENELLSSGFVVRDRQLFNQIIENNENNLDYEVLKQKSDTELIIELSQLKHDILYETNKFLDGKGNEKIESYTTHKKYGAMVEYKVIIVENNQYAGVYRFNYTPCTEPCMVSFPLNDAHKRRKEKPVAYEYVEKDEMEEFIRYATKQLVVEMRR